MNDVINDYECCIDILIRCGIMEYLPITKKYGIYDINKTEYPAPSLNEITDLCKQNNILIDSKFQQGFTRLIITPLASPLNFLAKRLLAAITGHPGPIFQTEHDKYESFKPVRINSSKIVWVWQTLLDAFDTDNLEYFPITYTGDRKSQTKASVITNKNICAVPGWSVAFIEDMPLMPLPGKGEIIGDRKQLETSQSPREYMQILRGKEYHGETGMTIEDFITTFLIRLKKFHEVSNDISDSNALWCLGQYMQLPYADTVPTGRWHRDIGRIRIDLHRTGNKLCTKNCGASTMVRLIG